MGKGDSRTKKGKRFMRSPRKYSQKKQLNTGKMENKSEYGIYEEFLKNFDSVNYKNKDSSIINNEFQKVISELCEKDMINVALQAELDRQVFLIRKSFEFQDDETKGTIKGLSWQMAGTQDMANGNKIPFYWPDVRNLTKENFEFFEQRYKKTNNLYAKTEYGLMVYFGQKTDWSKNNSFKLQLCNELISLAQEYYGEAQKGEYFKLGYVLNRLELALQIAINSKFEDCQKAIIEQVFDIQQHWSVNDNTKHVPLNYSRFMLEHYSICKKYIDFEKVIERNKYAISLIEKDNLYIPTVKIDIQTSLNKYKSRSEALENIINSFKNEVDFNQDFYKEYEDKINIINEQLEYIQKSILNKSQNIEVDNQIRNLIISALRNFNAEMDKNRTDKEKENVKYKQEKNDFCNLIIDYIIRIANKPDIPKFPDKVTGISKKLYQGFAFVKKAKYDGLFLEDEFYEVLFNKEYSKERILKITSNEELEGALQGIKDIKKIETWYNKVDKFIEEYLSEETFIEKDGLKNTVGETPGEISSIHYDFLFNDLSKDYDIIIIDQPEDDISSTKITQELLKHIKQVRDYKQIIIATHNPLLVVNLDVDNVICLNKNYKNEISVKDGCLEYNCKEYKIIDEVADIMDGGKEAVERRFRLYGN